MFIDSFEGLQNRKLYFITDANGTVHLLDNIVSRAWLKKNHPLHVQQTSFISKYMQSHTRIIDCTGLGLTGNEENNLTLEDF
ncbi:hypothetical protein [Metabacillus sediminilitoris]|uniref:Uncharacterized protein n=1 Tax=Metabacillus sediminilitoris TaxID=2567941 RepID=A0A4S4BW23_9BACI|nr:hypothetical protein [Metabacillus sediminilitoris]QGQ46324.1 hypothetical protein GMB29_14520 [Metabacillus sediminilitoris]THF79373.1 hypothetical protein E6W99_13620 [Metabacillus sediminilitoris]